MLPDSLVQMHKSGAAGWLKAVIGLTKVQLMIFLKAKLMLNLYSMGIRIKKSWTERNVSAGSDEEWVRPTKNTCMTVMQWKFKLTFHVLGTCYFINLLLKIALHTNSSITVAQDCGMWVGRGLYVIPVWVFAFWVPENHKGGALHYHCRRVISTSSDTATIWGHRSYSLCRQVHLD